MQTCKWKLICRKGQFICKCRSGKGSPVHSTKAQTAGRPEQIFFIQKATFAVNQSRRWENMKYFETCQFWMHVRTEMLKRLVHMSKSLSILEPGANLCPSGSPWMDSVSVYKTLFLVVKIDLARRWLLTSQEIVRSTVQQICVECFLQPTFCEIDNCVEYFLDSSANFKICR